ncbi:uncharacterized protein LOC116217813 isoform X4 [Meleagris gallopavo]|uniref:uncharacterized protein LOC116217813 isoform X4 n=1 Tax=Meleagris gallopavo TaxID=9103 RepID=UPI0012ABB7AA|nr:uncharacterized protein LOC116217813 isoform X4 [Meleagris gallopavo]
MSEQEHLAAQTRPFNLKHDISIPDGQEELIKATIVSCNSTKVTMQTEYGQGEEDGQHQKGILPSSLASATMETMERRTQGHGQDTMLVTSNPMTTSLSLKERPWWHPLMMA